MGDGLDVSAVVLAAGQGTRFGEPKVDAMLRGRSFLDHVTDRLHEAGVTSVIAVVPPGTAVPRGVHAVENPEPEEGQSLSLRMGVAAVPAGHAAMFLLVDEPTIPVKTLRAVLEARGDRPIVAAEAGERFGPPVLVEPGAFAIVAAATGDTGLRRVLREHPDLVTAVPVAGHPPDVDTPEDLAALGGR